MLVDALDASGAGNASLLGRVHGGVTPTSSPTGAGVSGDLGVSAGLAVGGVHRGVASMLILAGLGLWGLKIAGFRFNVGVSN